MVRTSLLLTGALIGCHGGGSPDGETPATYPAPPVILSSTAGEFQVDATVVDNDCQNRDVDQSLQDVELKFAQVATGLSVFVDPDIGWIPCDGSITSFDCEWGNAPGSTPGGDWAWSLVGTSDAGVVEATLTLTVTCGSTTGDCQECSAEEDITGTIG